jgi:hypothetical protein
LQDSSALLTEFQSGVLLCCIVEKVELMRSIPGVTRPTGKQLLSKASSLHNITKALSILQQKKVPTLKRKRTATSADTTFSVPRPCRCICFDVPRPSTPATVT